MRNLSLEEVLYIHELTIKKHGGSAGIKNLGLVESSLNSGIATFDGKDLYPSIEEKISMITYSFVKNHGFEDGNKRVYYYTEKVKNPSQLRLRGVLFYQL